MSYISDTKYTFLKLVKEFEITIPIIQRDYAQGRQSKDVQAIREDFLDTIYDVFASDSTIDLDFVYGSVDGSKLLPLDGQQRLTTIYLLHWYAAVIEGKLQDMSSVLSRFSYETRVSSRDFCRLLCETEYNPEEMMPSEYIRNQNGFFRSWDNDLTVRAMLVMLDAIHEKFYGMTDIYNKLMRDIDNNPPITFNFLPLEQYSLTDDLYIKMNARGKALTDFENFKAKFIQHLKKHELDYEYFESRIDKEWTDLLWSYRSEDNTIDDGFMNLFTFLSEMLFLTYRKVEVFSEYPFSKGDVRALIAFYNTKEKVSSLYELLDLWKNEEEVISSEQSVFATTYTDGKVRIFDKGIDLFGNCIRGSRLSDTDKILLYSYMLRLIFNKKNNRENDAGLSDYIRVVRNMLIKVRMKSGTAYTSDFRANRHGVNYVSFIMDDLLEEDDVYKKIVTIEKSKINMESLRQEKEKAAIIISEPQKKSIIQSLEDSNLFRSCIHNVLKFVTEYSDDIDYRNQLELLYEKDNFKLVVRAMLSVGDYGIRIGNSILGERFYYGERDNWYHILSNTDNKHMSEIMFDFLDQYFSASSEDVVDSLEEVITENVKECSMLDWRYYLMKYPILMEDCPGVVTEKKWILVKRRLDNGFTLVRRLNGSSLVARHIILLYTEAVNQMRNLCFPSFNGVGSYEKGAVQLRNGVNIIITQSGSFGIQESERYECDIEAAEKVKSKFAQIDKSDMDYVEQLILFGRMLSE